MEDGLDGEPPALGPDGKENLLHAVNFRQVYATVLERWWGVDAQASLRGRHAALPLLRV